jgi:hypothetical protein
MQYGKAWCTIAKLSLPGRYLRDTADDAPATRSEQMFTQLEPGFAGTDLASNRAPPRAQNSDRYGPPMASRPACRRKIQTRAASIRPEFDQGISCTPAALRITRGLPLRAGRS